MSTAEPLLPHPDDARTEGAQQPPAAEPGPGAPERPGDTEGLTAAAADPGPGGPQEGTDQATAARDDEGRDDATSGQATTSDGEPAAAAAGEDPPFRTPTPGGSTSPEELERQSPG